jgi:hypothetical protein
MYVYPASLLGVFSVLLNCSNTLLEAIIKRFQAAVSLRLGDDSQIRINTKNINMHKANEDTL